jgi:DNA-binding winged helix-turn-helix (wHTH) protein
MSLSGIHQRFTGATRQQASDDISVSERVAVVAAASVIPEGGIGGLLMKLLTAGKIPVACGSRRRTGTGTSGTFESSATMVASQANALYPAMKRANETYEFGPFRLEVGERRLLRDGQPLQLRAKVFDTLRVLVQNHGRLVGKDELMKAVWPDAIVEEGNLAHNLTVLRRTLGGKEAAQQYVETVPGQGYRFIAAVTAVPQPGEPLGTSAGQAPVSWEQRLEAARAALASTGIATSIEHNLPGHVVGRAKELAELLSAFQIACSGQARVFCIGGEPGVGKSTLFQQFLVEQRSGGVNCAVAIGRCSERLAESEAYLPVLEALEGLVSGPSGCEVAELMKLVAPTWYVQVAPLWASADPSFAAVVSDAKAASRERMKRELASFLQEISRIQPVVVFLDDLHWADASTTELLAYLPQKLAPCRVLIAVAYRPSEMLLGQHPFVAIKHELQKQHLCREMTVELLSREDIRAYLSLEIPDHEMPGDFAELVHRRTEGNPLFMVDLVRHLREQGALDRPFELTEYEMPTSVRGMIQRRLDQLNEGELQLLAAAAVQGQEFDSRILADVLHLPPAVVEERLRRLDRVHFLVRFLRERELPDQSLSLSYTFAHALYQQAIQETATPSRRAELSQAAAEALLRRYGDSRGPVASNLALLFECAREFDRAADHYIEAAANAARLFANEEAVSLSKRAIANAEKLHGAARHSRVLAAAMRLAQFHLALSRFDEAAADFELAEQAAEEAGDIEGRVRAVCGRAMALFGLQQLAEMRREGERAIELARASGSEAAEATADTIMAIDELHSGDLENAERRFNRAIPILRRDGLWVQSLDAIGIRGLLHAWRLEYEEVQETSAWVIEQARKLDVPFYILENNFVLGMALANQGRLSQAADVLKSGVHVAELNGERYFAPRLTVTLAWVYQEMRDTEASIRLGNEAGRLAREMNVRDAEAYAQLHLARQSLDLNDPREAAEHLRHAEELLAKDHLFKWRHTIRLQEELADYWLACGDLKKSAAHAISALEQANRTLSWKHIAWARKLIGDVAAREERFTDAEQTYQAALRVLESHPCPVVEWKILAAWAGLANTQRQCGLRDELLGRCGQVKNDLAESIADEKSRRRFLSR